MVDGENLTEEHRSLDTVGFEGGRSRPRHPAPAVRNHVMGNTAHHRVPEALRVCYVRISRGVALGTVLISFSSDSDWDWESSWIEYGS